MIPEKLTLRELIERKAKNYFHESRDKKGIPSKSIEQCYSEAAEDYGPEELDVFNIYWKSRWNRVMSADQQVVWADGTYDDARDCDLCKTACLINYPVHRDKYKEVSITRTEGPDEKSQEN